MKLHGFVLMGLALVGCVPGQAFDDEPTQPLTQLSLTGDSGQLHLKSGCQADANYKASYDNPKNVAKMDLQLFANGTIKATCYDAQAKITECSDAPIIASVSVDPSKPGVSFVDLLGKLVASYQGDGSNMVPVTTVPGGTYTATTATTPPTTTTTYPTTTVSTDPCEAAKLDAHNAFCAEVNRKLAEAHITDYSLDCSKVLDSVDQRAIAAANKNVWSKHSSNPRRCLPFVEDAADSAKHALKQNHCKSSVSCNWMENARMLLLSGGVCSHSPLVLDLDGNGIQLSSVDKGVHFDLANNGEQPMVAWPRGGDALLVMDRNHNGTIDGASELFGSFTANKVYEDGFEALGALDANKDGLVDSKDGSWARLQVWHDLNRDGHSSPDELRTLRAAGVKALSLAVTRLQGPAAFDAHGNGIPLRAEFVRADDTRGQLVDAFLRFKPSAVATAR